MYAAIKHLHILTVALSGAGFFLRGLLMLKDSSLLRTRWIRILPHINDTLLLGAAIALVMITHQYPFVVPWVTAKIFGLIIYIIVGSVALKAGRTRGVRKTAWLAAMLVFAYVVSVALTRNPWGILSRVPGG